MFKRKILAALYTAILLTIVTGVYYVILIPFYLKDGANLSEVSMIFGFLPFVVFYALIGNFLYGFPVSSFAEYITKNLAGRKQLIFSFTIHIFFGLVTLFFLDGLALYAIISSILFFLIDERLRGNHNRLFKKTIL